MQAKGSKSAANGCCVREHRGPLDVEPEHLVLLHALQRGRRHHPDLVDPEAKAPVLVPTPREHGTFPQDPDESSRLRGGSESTGRQIKIPKTSVAFQLVLDVFNCPFGILFCEP